MRILSAKAFTTCLQECEAFARRLSDGSPKSRTLVCIFALLILFLRLPSTFLRPEFWAEDGPLISAAYNNGWASLTEPLGGAYFNIYGSIVAKIAMAFPPAAWPWVTMYGAHVAVVITVLVVTSPRLDLPYRGLAALALVATPQREIFDSLANAQWVLMIVVFVMPFLKAHKSRLILLGDASLVVLTGLEGPFVAFVIPIYCWRIYSTTGPDRMRLLLLLPLAAGCAAIQIIIVSQGSHFDLIEPEYYNSLIWIFAPIRWLDGIRAAGIFVHHPLIMTIGSIIMMTGAVALAVRDNFREIKIGMLIFAGSILYAGLYKFRNHVELFSNDRYIYSGSVFFFWYIGCLAALLKPHRRVASNAVVAILVTLICWNVGRKVGEYRVGTSTDWSKYSNIIGTRPLHIIIAPSSNWSISLQH